MPGEIVEGINPTRMELLNIRRKRSLAEKGHKLLGEKRDALVIQFFEVLETRKRLKKEVSGSLANAHSSLEDAQARMGYLGVEAYSKGVEGFPHPSISSLNIMGVKVPVVQKGKPSRGRRPWGIGTTPHSLDEARGRYQKAVESILKLAETEGAVEHLAMEIEKTKRRVNALEHIFIPRLHNTEKYITMQLQEREREDFFRRKRIKSIMERSEKNIHEQ